MSQNDRSIVKEGLDLELETTKSIQSIIYAELLNPLDSRLLNFGKWLEACSKSDFKEPIDSLYLLPLSIILLDNRHQTNLTSTSTVRPLLQFASKTLIRFCEQRNYQERGLPLLFGPQESLLPAASFWEAHPNTPLIDPSFLALTAKALESLTNGGEKFSHNPEEVGIWNELLPYSMNEYLWNEEYGLYLPLNGNNGQQIETNSIAGLLPLLAPLADQEQAEAMYRCLAMNFVHPLHFYFPTECIEPASRAKTLNLFINYLLYQGLLRYEFTATALALKKQTVEDKCAIVSRSSLREVAFPKKGNDPCAKFILEAFQAYPTLHFSNRD